MESLLLLILVPIAAWDWARRYRPLRLWRITGAAFGVIVDPFCLGLYSAFFASPLGLVPGLIGLTAGLLHGVPGYEAAIFSGVVERGDVVEGIDHVWISGVNAIVWGILYGTLGWFIDRRRNWHGTSR